MNLRSWAWATMIAVCGKTSSAQTAVDVQGYVETYKSLAMSEMLRSGIPAAITLAQGIHETLAGTSDLVKKSNNHFGIKCKNTWTGARVRHDDDARQECFRSYPTAADSYRDHSDFLRGSDRYADLFRLDPTDYKGWAYGLKKDGYATNIRYSQILIKLVEDYDLEQYTLIAMGKTPPADNVAIAAPAAPPSPDPNAPQMLTGFADDSSTTGQLTPAVYDSANAHYPDGAFFVRDNRVVFARAGSSLLAISNEYNIPLSRLLEWNGLREENTLSHDQLLYLQRPRRPGSRNAEHN